MRRILFAIVSVAFLSAACGSLTTEKSVLKQESKEAAEKVEKPQTEQERNAEIQEGANWLRNSKQSKEPPQTAPSPQNRDTEIASIMVSVSCAGNKGLIPRSQMGSMMKEMFQNKGINSAEVYGNWDYYWGIARQVDAVNETNCLK